MDRSEFEAWLRLLQTPTVGRATARRLLASFGSPQGVLASSVDELTPVVGRETATNLMKAPAGFDELLERSWNWLAEARVPGRHVLTLGDPDYPAALLETADPPLMLYAQGRLDCLSNSAIAVVGSRNATPQGLDNARTFSSHLSQEGISVVSGLALGIDGAAHEGALEGVGSTIAVVGTGLDRVYPRSHLELAHRIAETGLILSEYVIGAPPLPEHFPQRNRIIAGLAHGTLVVEAALKSGSLITARLALECGREVFAIPGSIHSPTSRGCHALIKQGAKLVETAQDILEEIRHSRAIQASPLREAESAQDRNHPLLQLMGYDPITLDGLCDRSGLSAADLSVQLLDLEIAGKVVRLPGQLFQRRAVG